MNYSRNFDYDNDHNIILAHYRADLPYVSDYRVHEYCTRLVR
jgi:hypothetical protein